MRPITILREAGPAEMLLYVGPPERVADADELARSAVEEYEAYWDTGAREQDELPPAA